MGRKSKFDKLPIIHSKAAGIDIGSKFHMTAIGQSKEEVRKFGVYTEDLHELASWLVDNDITSVAMESTGSYWKGLFVILQDYGLNPILVNGSQVKNVKGRKTDVQDCQWIQRLHSLGLLSASFLPDNVTDSLKYYNRHRKKLIENAADYTKKMQKAMRLMNIRLDNVLSDICGKSGQKIIRAIIEGQRDAHVLASLASNKVKKSTNEIEKALTGDWRSCYIFELKQSYEMYQFFQQQIAQCEVAMEEVLENVIQYFPKERVKTIEEFKPKKKKQVGKNSPKFNVEKLAYGIYGVDLSQIDGVSRATLLTILSEVGDNFDKFPSASHFAAWTGLAPNNKISGGRILSGKTTKRTNPLVSALRSAANSIGNKKTGALNQFFKRLAFKKGRIFAITATARKIAVIIWNMVNKKEEFKYLQNEEYQQKIREIKIKNIQKQIKKYQISPEEIKPLVA